MLLNTFIADHCSGKVNLFTDAVLDRCTHQFTGYHWGNSLMALCIQQAWKVMCIICMLLKVLCTIYSLRCESWLADKALTFASCFMSNSTPTPHAINHIKPSLDYSNEIKGLAWETTCPSHHLPCQLLVHFDYLLHHLQADWLLSIKIIVHSEHEERWVLSRDHNPDSTINLCNS